jgi:hypothetical protein
VWGSDARQEDSCKSRGQKQERQHAVTVRREVHQCIHTEKREKLNVFGGILFSEDARFDIEFDDN